MMIDYEDLAIEIIGNAYEWKHTLRDFMDYYYKNHPKELWEMVKGFEDDEVSEG
jgi:hypothetical protein